MSDDNYKPQHAAPIEWDRNRKATERAKRYHGRHRANPPEPIATRFTGHGIGHDLPADVRLLPLTGPQSPGEAW